ncbi:MAG: leader peptidase (prepilin peptidase)/N-methyltransferase [Alteromonadaceae bacterium]
MLTQVVTVFEIMPIFFFICIGLLSLSVGSFLNVVVYRLPKMLEREWYGECREFLAEEVCDIPAKHLPEMTLSKPDSTCPKCDHKIRFYENIPVLSWLVLRGKCSQCDNAISKRYPLVELITCGLGLVIAGVYGVSTFTVFMLILTWGLVALTLIDLDHMLLPDQIVMPLLWLGLLFNINGGFVPLNEAIIGAVVGYTSLYSIFWLFKLVTGKDGMGYGDFKLFALFGAWIGWQLLPLLILMASGVAAVVGISLIVFKGHKREQAIPFGPYLAVAGWITMVWGEGIWAWYLSTIL